MKVYKKTKLSVWDACDCHIVWIGLIGQYERLVDIGEGKTKKAALKHAVNNLKKHLAAAKKMLDKL